MASNSSNKRRRLFSDIDPSDELKATTHNNQQVYKAPERASRRDWLARRDNASEKTKHDSKCILSRPCNEYTYTTLDDTQIRLLDIKPGFGDQEISCSLRVVQSHHAGEFEALSYVWGAPFENHRILVDGKSFFVGTNLYGALHSLRSQHQTVRLWVDAICINQDDLNEKNVQVSRMGDIYVNAVRTIVWMSTCHNSDMDIASSFITRALDPEYVMSSNLTTDYGILSLGRLLQNTTQSTCYWSRLWIIQELILSKSVVFRFGNREINMQDLADVVEIIRARLSEIRVSYQASPYATEYGGLLKSFEHSNSIKLFDAVKDSYLRGGSKVLAHTSMEKLLYKFRESESSNPRDRIFALLSLVPEEERLVSIDYTRSIRDGYTQFLSLAIKRSQSLDIMCRAWAPLKTSDWSSDLTDPDLQFHVPSWIATRHRLPYGDPARGESRRIHAEELVGDPTVRKYYAHNGSVAQVKFGMDDITGTYNGSLCVKGIRLCQLEQLSTRMAEGIISKECIDILGGIIRNTDGEVTNIPREVWRTLCADKDENGRSASVMYEMALWGILKQNPELASIDPDELCRDPQPAHVKGFLSRAQAVTWNRKAFRSRDSVSDKPRDLVGLAPQNARRGDVITILYGCSVPVLLRPHIISPQQCLWEMIGECYVDGIMDGEMLLGLSSKALEVAEQTFEIR